MKTGFYPIESARLKNVIGSGVLGGVATMAVVACGQESSVVAVEPEQRPSASSEATEPSVSTETDTAECKEPLELLIDDENYLPPNGAEISVINDYACEKGYAAVNFTESLETGQSYERIYVFEYDATNDEWDLINSGGAEESQYETMPESVRDVAFPY